VDRKGNTQIDRHFRKKSWIIRERTEGGNRIEGSHGVGKVKFPLALVEEP
jgi:hypothetical protein